MNTDRFKLSLVGCGEIANFMAWFARITPGINLTAACDISLEKAEEFAEKHRISHVFQDYSEMLTNGGFDAVYLAVPHNLHFEMMEMAIDAGIHIFVEKPITLTYVEAKNVLASAAAKGIKIGVNYQYRYDSGCHRLVRAVQKGSLGRVLYARINIPWHRDRTYFDDSPWHKSKTQAGGGTLITQASHLIDIVLWAVGSPPVVATGYTSKKIFTDVEVEDFAAGTVELENGTVIQITSSMVASVEQPVSVEIYGEKATAIYTNNPWPRLKVIGVKPKMERPPQWGFHALHRSLKGFRDWIMKDKTYLISGEETLPTLRVVEAVYKSAQVGKRVKIL